MKRVFFAFLLLVLPLAFSQESVPALPALYWGDINAPCSLTTLAPSIVIRAEFNGSVLATLAIQKDGNLFRFGGPSYVDPKLTVSGLAEGTEFNVVLYYSFHVAPFVLGSEDFNAGEVKYLLFTLSDSSCSEIFPSPTYSLSISLPSDCNGSLSGLSIKAYYGSTEIYSGTLSGDKSASKSITINGLAHDVPEGATITFKVCNGSNCASKSFTYHYGYTASESWSISCSSLFPSATQQEQAVTGEANAPAEPTTEQNLVSSTTSTTDSREENVSAELPKVSGPPSVPVPEDEQNKPVVKDVLEKIDRGTRRVLGMPPDVALVVAVLVVIIIVVAIRFIL